MFKATLNLLLILALGGCFVSKSVAQTHKGISFQGVIKLPTGDYPTRSGMTINARILSPNGCVLREEEFSGVNISNGYLNLAIGTGLVGGHDPSLSLAKAMDNSSVISSLTCLNSDGSINASVTSFNPTITSGIRKLRVSLTIDSYPIVADFNMRAVSYAINSETLNGKSDADFVAVNNAKNLNQANMESIFQRFTKLDALLNNSDGTGTNLGVNITGSANNVSGVVAVANGGTGASDAATARTNLGLGPLAILNPSGTADNTTYLRGDGTWATVSSVGSETDPTVQSFAKNAPGAGLSVTSNQLTVSYGTTAGTAAQGNDSRITGAFQSSTTLSGDLSGTLPSPVVEKIKGQSISAAGTSTGQVLRYAGASSWTPGFVSMSDLRSSVTGSAALSGTGCAAGETLSWSSVSDSLACISISITKSQISDFPTLAASATTDTTDATNITAGTLSVARLPTSVTDGLWSASSGNVSRASGYVGIGTTAPYGALHINNNNGPDSADDFWMTTYSNTATPGMFAVRARGDQTTPAPILNGDTLFTLSMNGYNGSLNRNAATIKVVATNDFNTSPTADMIFYTNSGGAAATEKMRITASGNVGIGTGTPASALHVGTAPVASPNAPLLALGSAPFNGSSGGHFVGNTNGTVIGVNTASGYTGDFLNFEVWGTSKFKIDSSGTITSSGNIVSSGNTTSTGNYSTTGNISTTGTGSITSAGPLISNSTTASTSPSTGALVVSGGAGIGGALNVGGSAYLGNSSANYVTINGAASGSSPTITAAGSDANINLTFTPKGSGNTIFSSGNVGIGTTSPVAPLEVSATNTATSGSNYGGIRITPTYNQSGTGIANTDLLINRTETSIGISPGNQYLIAAQKGGVDIFTVNNAGTASALTFAAQYIPVRSVAATLSIGASSSSTVNIPLITMANGTFSQASGTTSAVAIKPIYNQSSSTAANTDLLINRTETSTGSGAQNLIDAQVGGTSRFNVSNTGQGYFAGNVGIGTTAPGTMLVISGANKGTNTTVMGTTPAVLHLSDTNNALGAGPQIAFSSAYSGSFTITGATIGSYKEVAAGLGSNQYNHSLVFQTSSYPSGPVERMRINSAGNVGIGTSAPTNILSLNGDSSRTMWMERNTTADTAGNNLTIQAGGATSAATDKSGGGLILSSGTATGTGSSAIYFQTATAQGSTNTTDNTPTTKMTILGNGNVGVGTTAPAAPLTISSTTNPTLQIDPGSDVNANPTIYLKDTGTSGGFNIWYSNSSGSTFFDSKGNVNTYSTNFRVKTDGTAVTALSLNANGVTIGGSSMYVQQSGNVGIGTTTPGYKLDVNGDANIASGSSLRFGGTQVCTSAGCTSSSDERLKENIQPLENSLENILKLQGVEYDYKDKAKFGDKHQIGVIAQDVEKVYPEVVITDGKTSLKSVAYDHLIAPLIEAVKTLYNRVVGLEAQQATVDAKVQQLEQENARLKSRADKAEKENAEIKARLEKIEKALNSK